MSEVIAGRDSIIEILVDSVWTPVFCGKDLSVEYTPEFVLKTGPNSVARERIPRLEDWVISVSGLTKIVNEENVSFFYLIQEAVRRSLQSVRATFINSDGDEKVLTFDAWIGPSTITGPVNQFDQCSAQFIPTGGLGDLSDPEDPIATTVDILSDWWTTSNGDNFIDGASATGSKLYTLTTADDVKEVDVEGNNFNIITGTPAAGTRQCKLDLANSKIIFPADLIFDGTQTVFVLFERPS